MMTEESSVEDMLRSIRLRRLLSSISSNPNNVPTQLAHDSSIGNVIIIISIILGIAFAGLMYIIWRCRRRAYKGFEKLNPNPPEDSDEEEPARESPLRRKKSIGATMLDIKEEEQNLMKRVETDNFDADEVDPLFGRMPESTKPSSGNEVLLQNEVVLNTSPVLQRNVDQASFDVGDASSNEVSSVSEDSCEEIEDPQKEMS